MCNGKEVQAWRCFVENAAGMRDNLAHWQRRARLPNCAAARHCLHASFPHIVSPSFLPALIPLLEHSIYP